MDEQLSEGMFIAIIIISLITIFICGMRIRKISENIKNIEAQRSDVLKLIDEKEKKIGELKKVVFDETIKPEMLKEKIFSDKELNDRQKNTLAGAFAVGATGFNLIEYYLAAENHSNILEVLKERSPVVWEGKGLDFFYENVVKGAEESICGYRNLYVGQKGEIAAKEFLGNIGYDVQPFEALNHEGTDLHGVDLDGNEVSFSVKTVAPDNILNEIYEGVDNRGVRHFVINDESYDFLSQNGYIEQFSEDNIEIINGGFSLDEFDNEFTEYLDSGTDYLSDASDAFDDLLPIGTAILAYRTFKNLKRVKNGISTWKEAASDFGVDVARTATGGVLGATGAQIGSAVGTFILPGVGTFIGTGVGAFFGVKISSGIFNNARNWIKWGSVISAQEYFGNRLLTSDSDSFFSNFVRKRYDFRGLEKKKSNEFKMLVEYEDELNIYCSTEPTMAAVVCQEAYAYYQNSYKRIFELEKKLKYNVIDYIEQAVSSLPKKVKEKFKLRLLGEIQLQNWEYISPVADDERLLYKAYCKQSEKSPNYPWKFSCPANVPLSMCADEMYYS